MYRTVKMFQYYGGYVPCLVDFGISLFLFGWYGSNQCRQWQIDTIFKQNGGWGYGWFQKKKKQAKKFQNWKKYRSWHKMLEKILHRLQSGKIILSLEVWEKNSYPNRIAPLRPKVIFSLRDSESLINPWTIRKVMGEGGAKAKEKFPQEILNKKIYSYGFCPEKIYAQWGKKKDFYLTCAKKILHLLISPPPPPHHHSGARNRQH